MSSPDVLVRMAREQLTAALLSDALDACGLIHQIMDRSIRAVDEEQVLCGRARTGRLVSIGGGNPKADVNEALVDLVDSLRTGEVLVLACGPHREVQAWGDLLSRDAVRRGVAGCVTDATMRDISRIREIGFQAFCAHHNAVDTRGRLVATDVPMQCGGVWVSPGDLIFGDVDAVVVVPREAEVDVIRTALELGTLERQMMRALRGGDSLTESYLRYRAFPPGSLAPRPTSEPQ